MFKVNNKNTGTTSLTPFWCFYCKLWTYFIPFSSVSSVDFEQVNVNWVITRLPRTIWPIFSSFPIFCCYFTRLMARQISCQSMRIRYEKLEKKDILFLFQNSWTRKYYETTMNFCWHLEALRKCTHVFRTFSKILGYS